MNEFEGYLKKVSEIGFVEEVVQSVIRVSGLPGASLWEKVIFESGVVGQVSALKPGFIEIMVFSRTPVRVGERVARTKEIFSIAVDDKLLGQTINALAMPFDANITWDQKDWQMMEVDSHPLEISARKKITRQLHTGTIIVDLMNPLGYGQRELILGDRKTGKAQLAWRAVLSHAAAGGISVYACIGRKKSDIHRIANFFANHQISDRTVMVASGSYDSSAEIYLTPYTAMTIAEYFRDKGRDVLVILDDMTTHARYYRELSLLGRRFPGRDSYPGDIFHVQSKLLERAGNFVLPGSDKEVAITCIPLARTVQGDITGYIQTNLMSMADGHIYLDTNLFFEGKRPPVNPFLSVTRVGRQTQTLLQRDISQKLIVMLASFEKTSRFIKFGTELGENSREILAMGNRIWQLFSQPTEEHVPSDLQVILLGLLISNNWNGSGLDKAMTAYSNAPELQKQVRAIIAGCETVEQLSAQVNKNIDILKTLI